MASTPTRKTVPLCTACGRSARFYDEPLCETCWALQSVRLIFDGMKVNHVRFSLRPFIRGH